MQQTGNKRKFLGVTAGVAIALFRSTHCWAVQPVQNTVTLTAVPALCKPYAVAVGQRLQKPGKERIAAAGSLYWISNGKSQTAAVRVVWQIPLQIRIEGTGSLIVLNWGQNSAGQEARDNSNTVESLLDDTVEGLISLNNQAGGSRLVGKAFRDKTAASTGATYDVVQLFYPSLLRSRATVSKLYWFDSKTKLLYRVTYKSSTGGTVEVRTSNWQTVNGEAIPFLIERQENGQVTVRLTLASAVVGAGAQDGIFGGN